MGVCDAENIGLSAGATVAGFRPGRNYSSVTVVNEYIGAIRIDDVQPQYRRGKSPRQF